MKTPVSYKTLATLLVLLFHLHVSAQTSLNAKVDSLFGSQDILEISMDYSIKEIRKNTKDSIWTKIPLTYKKVDQSEQSLEVRLKTRGNFRLNKCYFPPIKVKIKKSQSKGTIFKGHKELKLVMPCRKEKTGNDYVIREYLAYKLFESISPTHFKTRLLKINFTEIKGKKQNTYEFYGFFIEDVKKMAKRQDANVVKRYVHPLSQDPESSIRSAMFQYMMGNVDFSAGHQHNGKLIFLNKRVIPIPYDFDMSGFVDPSYGELPMVDGKPIELANIKERLYRGFKRDEAQMQNVRADFIAHKSKFVDIIDLHAPHFEFEREKKEAEKYLESFYSIIENDKRFQREIINQARKQ